jgi:hypothetical protein
MAFLWGVQDSSISIHLDAILGFEFESNKEPFSCDVLIESITAFSVEIAQSFILGRDARMIYIGCVGIYGIFAASCSYFFSYKPMQHHGHVKRTSSANSKEGKVNKFGINYDETEERDSILNPNRYIATSE